MDEGLNQQPPPPDMGVEVQGGIPKKKIISLIVGVIVFVVLIVVLLVFVLPMFKSKKPQNVELTYWGIWQDAQAFKEISDEFTKTHPNIKIKFENQDIKSLGKYYERLTTRINNGTGPDIYRYHNSWITELKPYLLPLPQDVVTDVGLVDKYFPVVDSDLKVDGAYYGVPIQFDSLALFVNVELFKAAGISSYPKNWDELTTIARQLTVKDAEGKIQTSGAALGTFDNIAHAPDIVSLLLIQNGANIKDLTKTPQNSADALEFYTSFAKGDSKVWDNTLENSKLAFARGKVAMYFGYSWDIFEIKGLNPSLQFATLPVPNVSSKTKSLASYWVEGVSSKTKYPEESFEFLKYLTSKEVMVKLYEKESKVRLFGSLYPRSDMADLLKSNTLIYPFVEQGKNASSTIFSSNTYDEAMTDSLNSYLGNAIRSMVNDNTSPQSAIETLSQGVTQVLGRYENQ